jgi:uncharacterized DUF497 family protein
MITWDEKKRKQVIKDHGIDFSMAKEVFDDPFAIDFEDFAHSAHESRLAIIGKTAAYGLLFVVYVVVADDIRLVTARRAERWMVRKYENQRRRL